jgi:hypothetical protein
MVSAWNYSQDTKRGLGDNGNLQVQACAICLRWAELRWPALEESHALSGKFDEQSLLAGGAIQQSCLVAVVEKVGYLVFPALPFRSRWQDTAARRPGPKIHHREIECSSLLPPLDRNDVFRRIIVC